MSNMKGPDFESAKDQYRRANFGRNVVNSRSKSSSSASSSKSSLGRKFARQIAKDESSTKHKIAAKAKQETAKRSAQAKSAVEDAKKKLENSVQKTNDEIVENDEIQAQGLRAYEDIKAGLDKGSNIVKKQVVEGYQKSKSIGKTSVKVGKKAGKLLDRLHTRLYGRKLFQSMRAKLHGINVKAGKTITRAAKQALKHAAVGRAMRNAAAKHLKLLRQGKHIKIFGFATIRKILAVISHFFTIVLEAVLIFIVVLQIVFIIAFLIIMLIAWWIKSHSGFAGWEYLHYECYENPVQIIQYCEEQYRRDMIMYMQEKYPNESNVSVANCEIDWARVYKLWLLTNVYGCSQAGFSSVNDGFNYTGTTLDHLLSPSPEGCDAIIGRFIWGPYVDDDANNGASPDTWRTWGLDPHNFYNCFFILYYECETSGSDFVYDDEGFIKLKHPYIKVEEEETEVIEPSSSAETYWTSWKRICVVYYNSTSTTYEAQAKQKVIADTDYATGDVRIIRSSTYPSSVPAGGGNNWTPKAYGSPITSSSGVSKYYYVSLKVQKPVYSEGVSYSYKSISPDPYSLSGALDYLYETVDPYYIGSGALNQHFTQFLYGGGKVWQGFSQWNSLDDDGEPERHPWLGGDQDYITTYLVRRNNNDTTGIIDANNVVSFRNLYRNAVGALNSWRQSELCYSQATNQHYFEKILEEAHKTSGARETFVAHLYHVLYAYLSESGYSTYPNENFSQDVRFNYSISQSTKISELKYHLAEQLCGMDINEMLSESDFNDEYGTGNVYDDDHYYASYLAYYDDVWQGHGKNDGFNAGSVGRPVGVDGAETNGDWCLSFATYLASTTGYDFANIAWGENTSITGTDIQTQVNSVLNTTDAHGISVYDNWNLVNHKYWDEDAGKVVTEHLAPDTASAPWAAYFFYQNHKLVPSGRMLGGGRYYTPKPGDYIFTRGVCSSSELMKISVMANDGWLRIGHGGIVIAVDSTYVYTVEGNSSEQVSVNRRRLSDPDIYAYGLVF